MALEPFRRKIGAPAAAPLTRVQQVGTPDVGPEIARAGQQIFAALEPTMRKQAEEAAIADAANVPIRDSEGKLISKLPDSKGGLVYQQAYQKMVREKYLVEFDFDLQRKLDEFASENFNNPNKLQEIGLAHIEGVLSAVPEELRTEATQIAFREGQERFRSALSSYTSRQNASLINGTKSSIQTGIKRYTDLAGDPNASPEEKEKIRRNVVSLAKSLKELAQSDVEVNSLLEEIDFDIGTADEYTLSVENTPVIMDWVLKSMSVEDLNLTLNWLDGVDSPGSLNGTVTGGTQKTEATPSYVEQKLKSLFPKVLITSTARAPDHPLSVQNPKSYHNTVNGGRAIDVAPIPGVTFNEYVSGLKAAGFNIVEAIDETTPEAMKKYGSTGKHWHIAYGPTLNERAVTQDPEASNLNFNKLHEMFPSANVRSNLREAIRMRISDINRAESEAAAVARAEREEARQKELISAIESTTNDGIYNYSNKERNALDSAFGSTVNQAGGLNTEAGRKAAIKFISNYTYMPGDMKGWFTSNLRNPDSWKGALDLYNSTKNLTTQSGSSMGDVLADSLSAKDRALFDAALRMQSAGVQDAVIGAQIKNILSGKAYTSSEAQVQYNATIGQDAYRKSKTKALSELFGIEGIPPKDLSQNYDEAFAANLAIYQNDIEEAEKATRAQMRSLSVRNPIFFNEIGYKNLYNKIGGSPKAFNQILLNHLKTLTLPDGSPLLKEYMTSEGKIVRHIVGGANSTVKLVPLDGNVNEIGRYRVLLYTPGNRNKLEGELVIDFSTDLNPQIQAYTRQQRAAASAADRAGIEAARQQREQDVQKTQRIKEQSRTVSGSKL